MPEPTTVLRLPHAGDVAGTLELHELVLARRLLRVTEVSSLIGRYSASTLNRLICQGDLPVVIMPSRVRGRDPLRRIFRVPVAWLDRWIEMGDKEHPLFTARAEVGGRPGKPEPLYCTVAASAAACSVSERLAQDLVRLRRWAPVTRPGGAATIRVRSLDDWLWQLIAEAERLWFGVEPQGAVSA